MYGTIFHLKVNPGQEQNLVELFNQWGRERKSAIEGAVGGLLLKPETYTGQYVGVAVFEDKASYEANADDPEQHKWFTQLRELLTEDPTWEDGEYVAGDLG